MRKNIKKYILFTIFFAFIFFHNSQRLFCKSKKLIKTNNIKIVIAKKNTYNQTQNKEIKEKLEIAFSAYKARQYQRALSIVENILTHLKTYKNKQYNLMHLYAVGLFLKAQIYMQTGQKNKAKNLFKTISKKYTDIMYMFSDGTIIHPAYQSRKELKNSYF